MGRKTKVERAKEALENSIKQRPIQESLRIMCNESDLFLRKSLNCQVPSISTVSSENDHRESESMEIDDGQSTFEDVASDPQFTELPFPETGNNFDEQQSTFDLWTQFDGKGLSEQEIYLILLLLQVRHNMTDAAICDFAKLLNLAMKSDLNISMPTIKKKARIFSPTTPKFFYTSTSCGITSPVTDLKAKASCDTPNCTQCQLWPLEAMKKSSSFFCYVSIRDWLQFLVPHFYQQLRFDHQPNPELIHDVTDGYHYRRLKLREEEIKMRNGDYASKTLTISLGYDGANYVSNGIQSLWPIVGYINELPFSIRQMNGMLFALHAGKEKAASSAIFKPLIAELEEYDQTPLEITLHDGQIIRIYVRLLLVIADCPARCDLLNHKAHNGTFGCTWCCIETVYFRDGKNGAGTRRYPMVTECLIKTDEQWRQLISLAEQPKIRENQLFGIKGDCLLSRLSYIQLNSIAPPEYLHSQLIGTVKLLLQSWLGEITGVKALLDFPLVQLVNSKLGAIKFPADQIKKMPLLEEKDKWKATDYEVFMLYGFLALEDILPNENFNHFKMLVKIISTLCKREISKTDLEESRKLSREFIGLFGQLYPTNMHRYNIHVVLHLPSVVEQFGPLPTNSAFCVENTMGILVRRVETGTAVQQQTFNKTLTATSILTMCQSPISRLSPSTKSFAAQIFPKLSSAFPDKTIILQLPQRSGVVLNKQDRQLLSEFQDQFEGAKFYGRLKYGQLTITTTIRSTLTQTANNFVQAKGAFYRIIKIITFPNTDQVSILALKYDATASEEFYYISQASNISSQLEILNIQDIQSICGTFQNKDILNFFQIVNRHL